jgi:hypothetical protein
MDRGIHGRVRQSSPGSASNLEGNTVGTLDTDRALPALGQTSRKVVLLDRFDLGHLQAQQDSFARATGVASVITYPDGRPVTKPTNCRGLCADFARCARVGITIDGAHVADWLVARTLQELPRMSDEQFDAVVEHLKMIVEEMQVCSFYGHQVALMIEWQAQALSQP